MSTMPKDRPRDRRGRFYKNKPSFKPRFQSQSSKNSKGSDMSAGKRPHHSDHGQQGDIGSSVSPLRKKILSDETASWRTSPDDATNDFYPQYMQHNNDQLPPGTPLHQDREAPSLSPPSVPSEETTSPLLGSTTPDDELVSGLEGGKEGSRVVATGSSTLSSSLVDGMNSYLEGERQALSKGADTGLNDHLSGKTAPSLSYHKNSELPNNFDKGLELPEPGKHSDSHNGVTGDNIHKTEIVLASKAEGRIINAVDLEEVMSRAMSGVMDKLQSITTELRQVPAIKASQAKLDREIVQIRQDCYGIKESVRDLKLKEEERSSKHDALAKEVQELKLQMQGSTDPNQSRKPEGSNTEMDSLKKEAAYRNLNLIIEGIPELTEEASPEENTVEVIKTFFSDILLLPKFEVKAAFRLGKPRQSSSSRPRPIKVKFPSTTERDMVWRAKSVLAKKKDVKYGIKEDLPPKLRAQMSALIRVSQTAKKYPDLYHGVRIYDFNIYINGIAYPSDNLESLPSKLRPSVISTPGNIYVVVFYGRDSKFSNHFSCKFIWDNREFSSIEQYLAYRRAILATRNDLAIQAMGSQDPADSKRLMHILKFANSEPKWKEQRRDILFSGLVAKFSQNDHLRRYLLESGNRRLGEASTDTTWGIGRSLTDKLVLNPSKWIGENLLGTTLMEVREELSSYSKKDSNPHHE